MSEKFKGVKIDCFKDDKYSHYGECYHNITDKQLAEKLTHLIEAGWRRLEVELTMAGGAIKKKIVLAPEKKRKLCQQTRVHNNEKSPVKSIIDGGEIASEPVKSRNSGQLNRDSELILNGLAKAKDWKQLAIEDRKRRKRKK